MKPKKNMVLVGSLLLAVTTIQGCGAGRAQYVYAIEKTRTYHRENCAPVHMANTIKMTLSEAKAELLRPCPVCRPDIE